MATNTRIVLVDDLNDELEAAETIRFGLDGVVWEIDLSEGHAAQLRDALAPFIEAGRRIGGRRRRR